MTSAQALPLALVALAFILVVMAVTVAVGRVIRDHQDRRRELRLATVRPLLLRELSEDEPDLSSLNSAGRVNGRLLEELAWQMLSKVRGASRAALVDWLTERGAIEKARARTHKAGGVGRAKAAERLGAAGVPSTTGDVARLLNDRHAEVRIVATRALGKMGDPAVVPELLAALRGDKAVPTSMVSMALLHIGAGVVEPLLDGLTDEAPEVRAISADLLGMHGAMTATRLLIGLLDNDDNTDVRIRAAGALGRIGVPQGVEPLARCLAAVESPMRLRIAAASSLGQIGGSGALSALHLTLNHENHELALTAGEALLKLGDKGREILATVAEGNTAGSARASDCLAQVVAGSDGRQRRRSPSTMGRAS